MAKNLLIVESPAKAKTIEKILGNDFKVKSSFGHIRDLPVNEIGVDVENDFKPNYIISKDKTKVVKELKSEVKKVQEVWLATDEDREGEAISWHLSEVLGLDSNTVKRITFREITKPAVQKAIKNPRNIDINLVNAQQTRRILDRLVGYELSQLLWRKIKGKLSAGRVQSVALKLIVEREREIRNFVPLSKFKVYAIFDVIGRNNKKTQLKAELNKSFDSEKQVLEFLEKIKKSIFTISDIKVKPVKRNPAPPFTTSTMQQEASRKYGFGVKKTMMIAQRLYEKGLITYMRTDSTNISDVALGAITKFVNSEYGKDYHQFRKYSSKKNAQEAHEAIRPSYIEKRNVSGDKDEQRLYELIWKRTIASQMASAIMERTDVEIEISDYNNAFFLATGQVVKFDGFLKVYMESKDEEEDDDIKGMLPPMKKGQQLDKNIIEAVQKFTKAPARFTEATLVKKLEALGIGRPSTYAPTISKIMEKDRGYVVKDRIEGKERDVIRFALKGDEISKKIEKEIYGAAVNRLHPTDMGMVVIDFLEERFSTIMDYGFTAEVEKELDDIAEKGLDWHKIVADIYFPFHKEIEDTQANATRVRAKRELGKDPETGHTVLVQITRYGPVVQIGTREEVGEEGKPRFANLSNGMSMETITFEEAMKLFELPKSLGDYNGNEVIVGSGRFGPYVKYNNKFISIPKTKDPLSLTKDEAIELIKNKEEEDKPIGSFQDLPITKGKGRFGPFLKWNSLYINVPRKYDFENISIEDAIVLIENKIEKEKNRYIKKWDDENIAIENGRWGPFIRFKKKSVKLPKIDGKKPEPDELKNFTLEKVKEIIEAELPGSFKKKAAKKKGTKKK